MAEVKADRFDAGPFVVTNQPPPMHLVVTPTR
jgi:hypothetical protein